MAFSLHTEKSFVFPEFEWLVPKSELKIENTPSGIATRIRLDSHLLSLGKFEIEEYVIRTWKRMYQDLVFHLSEQLFGQKDWLAIKFDAQVFQRIGNGLYPDTELLLRADLFRVLTKEYVMPQLIYETSFTSTRELKIKEWRCGACGQPNPIEAKYCGEVGKHAFGCGKPRALLRHELSENLEIV